MTLRYPNQPHPEGPQRMNPAALGQLFFRGVDSALQSFLQYADTKEQRDLAQKKWEAQQAESKRRWQAEYDQRDRAYNTDLALQQNRTALENPELGELNAQLPNVRNAVLSNYQSLLASDPARAQQYAQLTGIRSALPGEVPADTSRGELPGWMGPRLDMSRMGPGSVGASGKLIPTTRMDRPYVPPQAPPPPATPYGPRTRQEIPSPGADETGTVQVLLPDNQRPGEWMLEERPASAAAPPTVVTQQQYNEGPAPAPADALNGPLAAGRRKQMAGIEADFGVMAQELGKQVTPENLQSMLVAVDQKVTSAVETRGGKDEWRIAEAGERVKESLKRVSAAKDAQAKGVEQLKRDLAELRAKAKQPAPRGGRGPSRQELEREGYQHYAVASDPNTPPEEQARQWALGDSIAARLRLPAGSKNRSTVELFAKAWGGIGATVDQRAGKGLPLDEKLRDQLVEASKGGVGEVEKTLRAQQPGQNFSSSDIAQVAAAADKERTKREVAGGDFDDTMRAFAAKPNEALLKVLAATGKSAGIGDVDKRAKRVVDLKLKDAKEALKKVSAAADKMEQKKQAMRADPVAFARMQRNPEAQHYEQRMQAALSSAQEEVLRLQTLLGMIGQ